MTTVLLVGNVSFPIATLVSNFVSPEIRSTLSAGVYLSTRSRIADILL